MFAKDIFISILTSVMMISVFTFVSVAAWAEQRRREREAFYRSEGLKKLADATGDQARQVIEMMREQDRNKERQRREGARAVPNRPRRPASPRRGRGLKTYRKFSQG